jgi:hypothetical protein
MREIAVERGGDANDAVGETRFDSFLKQVEGVLMQENGYKGGVRSGCGRRN